MDNKKPIRRKMRRWLLLGCGASLLIAITLIVYVTNSNRLDNTVLYPVMKQNMLSTAREWGRLAPIPESAEDFVIETSGGMFTRTFAASFHAPIGEIANWLDASPGTRDVPPTKEVAFDNQPEEEKTLTGSRGLSNTGIWYYNIKPAGGAAFAGVWVDVTMELVRFRVSWS